MIKDLYTSKAYTLLDPKETFIKGNIEKNTYIGYKNYMPRLPKTNGSKQEEMMLNVMMYGFYLQELNLYLDTHPLDSEAIRLFKKTREEYLNNVKMYEDKYGPLGLETGEINNEYWEWLNV